MQHVRRRFLLYFLIYRENTAYGREASKGHHMDFRNGGISEVWGKFPPPKKDAWIKPWVQIPENKLRSFTIEAAICWTVKLCYLLQINYQQFSSPFLWSPYGIGQAIIFLPCDVFCLLSFFCIFSSLNLSRRRLDVYHTFTHGMALVRIYDAGLKRVARGSLKIQDAQNRSPKFIWAPSHIFVGLYLRSLRHVSTIGKKC